MGKKVRQARSAKNLLVKTLLRAKNGNLLSKMSAMHLPLNYAIEKQRRSIIRTLVKNGADVNYKRKSDGATPLIVAALMGDYQLVNTLINAGASIEEYDQEKRTALIVAAKENNKNIVKKLLSVGANVNAIDESGLNALKHAEDLGHREVVKAIQDYKKLTGIK